MEVSGIFSESGGIFLVKNRNVRILGGKNLCNSETSTQ